MNYSQADCNNIVQVDTWNKPAQTHNRPDFKSRLNGVIKEQRIGKLWKEYPTRVSVYFWESPSVQGLHSKCHTALKNSQEVWTHSWNMHFHVPDSVVGVRVCVCVLILVWMWMCVKKVHNKDFPCIFSQFLSSDLNWSNWWVLTVFVICEQLESELIKLFFIYRFLLIFHKRKCFTFQHNIHNHIWNINKIRTVKNKSASIQSQQRILLVNQSCPSTWNYTQKYPLCCTGYRHSIDEYGCI